MIYRYGQTEKVRVSPSRLRIRRMMGPPTQKGEMSPGIHTSPTVPGIKDKASSAQLMSGKAKILIYLEFRF